MEFNKTSTYRSYDMTITRSSDVAGQDKTFEWSFDADATGLAAVIRSVDLATSEGKLAQAIGLKRKRSK